MLHVLEALLRKIDGYWYRHNVECALALHHRGEVRRDGLNPVNIATHLEVEWRARDVHPWDRGILSPAERATAFVKQSLADTEAAIHRLFATLPHVDVITLKVRDQISENVIIAGTVSRPAVSCENEKLSIGMRLIYLGLTYHSAGSLFETLEQNDRSVPAGQSFRGSGFRPGEPTCPYGLGAAQAKFAASSMLPDPEYRATCG
jgi:hypothetical protein